MYTFTEGKFNTRVMTRVSVLGVISFILMFFEFPLWFAPPFLKVDLGDMPALIGTFAMGPLAGVIVQLLKNLLNLLIEGTTTAGVGELSNFIVGSVFVYSAGVFYHRKKNFKNAIISLVIGVLAMSFVATFTNYFFIFPFYGKMMGLPLDAFVDMGRALNSAVVDLRTLMLFTVVPFNILKGIIVSLVTLVLYKKVSPILRD